MTDNKDKVEKMAREAGVPLDNIYTEDEFAKSFGGENARWMTNERWEEIVASSPPISEETLRKLKEEDDS